MMTKEYTDCTKCGREGVVPPNISPGECYRCFYDLCTKCGRETDPRRADDFMELCICEERGRVYIKKGVGGAGFEWGTIIDWTDNETGQRVYTVKLDASDLPPVECYENALTFDA